MFVLGSNDYYAPTSINPLKYFSGPSALQPTRPVLPWGDLVAGLRSFGWLDLSNRNDSMVWGGLSLALRGVDDPHIMLDRYEDVAGSFPDADLRIGVVHAPYLRVLNAFAADGTDLVIAGHTHGGQLCLPGGQALVTNCDLPRSMAKGLHSYRPVPARIARDQADGPWLGPDPGDPPTRLSLHVSAGLGTSPYAPIRFACPPEATLLTLVGTVNDE
jgi:predicted MPP superfamily phosphohydrolase